MNGYLVYSVQTPSRLRLRETGIITINLQNAGDSDLYVPFLAVEASNHGSIRLIDDSKMNLFQQKYFVFGSTENGPAGIMPPKSHSQIKFETKHNETYQSGRVEMILNTLSLRQDISTPNPFIQQKDNLRPSHYSQSEWNQIWDNFVEATGTSSLSFSKRVSDILNEISLGGRYVKNVDDIIKYLLEVADAPYTDRILERKLDFLVPSDEEVVLFVERYLSARIGSRTQESRLGKGWILPLWDTKIKEISDDVLILTIERLDFKFTRLNDSSFIDKYLGVISFGDKELIYRPYKQKKEFHFDRDTFALTEVISLVDDSYLKMEYKDTSLIKIRHSSGAFITVKYDSRGRIQIMQLQNTSAPMYNSKMLFVYDLDSGMLSEVRQDRESTRYVYFDNSTLKYILNPDRSINLYEYSKHGHLISKKLIKGNKEISSLQYSYRSSGVASVKKMPENKTFDLTFNENGEVILIRRKGFLPEKTVTTLSTEIQYIGDTIITKRTWNSAGNFLLIEDGNGDSLKPYFNDKNQLIGFIDGTGHEYKIKLNKNGSIDSILFPDGSKKRYNYTQNGHTVVTQNNGNNNFYYNERKQLIRKDISNGSSYAYTYDENGKLTNAENDNGKIEFMYTKDKVKTVSYPDVSLTYNYNEKGLLASLSTNKDYSVSYKYNDFDKIELVTDKSGKQILKAEYDASGKIVKKLLGNNATTTFSYDSVTGLLKNMTNYFPNGSVSSYFHYEYSLHLRRIAVHTQDGLWKFKYDRAGQVVSMTSPSNSVTKYTYDKSKNRIRVSEDDKDYETEVNDMNQYIKYKRKSLSYDKNGNMNFKGDGSLDELFSYDEDNKLVSYKSNSTDCFYRYDALENLHSKTCNNVTTRYIVNPRGNFGSDIIQQVTSKSGDETIIQYYYGGGEVGLIAARHGDGHMSYFMYDPIGTVQGILSENGDLLNSYHTDPFGQVINASETVTSLSLFTFVGQWGVVDFKEIRGVYFMRSRLYDSFTGRFVSIDSFGLKAHSKNLYAYCDNNPVHCNDPNGNFLNIALGAAVGAAWGVLDYALSTPYEDWSWGGAAGSALSGGVSGGMAASGAGLIYTVLATTAADVGAGFLSRKIDHQPYSFKDTKSDFVNSLIGQAQGRLLGKMGTRLKRLLEGKCQALHYITNPTPNVCGIPKDILKKLEQRLVRWILSKDPNDIIGPTGFGAAKFIDKESRLMYKIRFENDENATAPAQRVYIEHPYSQHLDPRSFQLEGFGFGNFSRNINSKALREMVNLTVSNGSEIVLRAFAGLDLTRRIIIWEFQSLDPKTGEAPLDPGVGFLPPNNGTSGQGYVTFSMQPTDDVEHLSTINANASIFFDTNDPIDTLNIFNTIDSTPPAVNGTVVNGTESSDSVTLSFEAFDSGSGVKYIDLFQREENGFSLFSSGLTEAVFVLPLQPGSSYSLVAFGIDHVGNRMDLGKVSPDNFMSINTSLQEIECQCSGNGNCSYGTNLCNCDDGFYGPNCNSTNPPPEPPVLELKSGTGIVNQSIELMISARNVTGSLEELEIFVTGFQNGTVFSAGELTGNGTLHLSYSEFGLLNMTTQQHGHVKLNILVVQTFEKGNISRSTTLTVEVYDSVNEVDIRLKGCYTVYSDLKVVLLNSTVIFNDETENSPDNTSSIVPHTTLLKMPPGFYPVNGTESGYKIGDTLVNAMFRTDNIVTPFNLTVVVTLEYTDLPPLTYSKKFQIKDFCDGECDLHKYGIRCDGTCQCNWQNTDQCDRFTGSCKCQPQWEGLTCSESVCPCVLNNTEKCELESITCLCKSGWTGRRCEVDIDECKNETVCDGFNHTKCVNWDGGYNCVCQNGYKNNSEECIECEEGTYGHNCESTCECVQNNTLECGKFNGTCTCLEAWDGSICDTDVDECKNNRSICNAFQNTTCQNNIPGYDCLCRRGYEQKNDSCVEIKDKGENKTVTVLSDERSTSVTIRVNITVKPTDNLQVEATYQRYVNKSVDMLSAFYKKELGSNFIKVIVQGIRLGSLIIDHDVITKNTEEGSQELAVAVVKMKSASDNNPVLFFDDKPVSVVSVSLNVKDVCGEFQMFHPCKECVTEQGKPTCKKVASSPKNDKDRLIMIISLSVGIPIAVVAISIIVACCVRKRKSRNSEKKVDDNVQIEHKRFTHEHPNPGFDATDTDDEAHSLRSNTSTSRYVDLWRENNQLPAWQNDPYYETGQKYDQKHNAYIYKGRNK